MKKLLPVAAAAALSVCGLTMLNTVRADDTVGGKVGNAINDTKNAVGNAADKTKAAAHGEKANWENGRVYTMLGQITNDAVKKGGLDNIVKHFNDADRDRIRSWVNDKNNKEKRDVLDGRIAQLQRDWKAKYNQDFKIAKDDVVFGNSMFTVAQGEIGKDAQLAGEKLPPADASHPVTGGDRNLEKGRNVAYVTVAESHGLPELKVPLIHELPDSWKIDVPDAVDGRVFYDNVLKQLTAINDMKDKWPDDVNDAYREVAHRMLMAILDVNDTSTGAAATFGGDKVKPVEKH